MIGSLLSAIQGVIVDAGNTGLSEAAQAISTIGGVVYLVVRDKRKEGVSSPYNAHDRARDSATNKNVDALCKQTKIEPIQES